MFKERENEIFNVSICKNDDKNFWEILIKVKPKLHELEYRKIYRLNLRAP